MQFIDKPASFHSERDAEHAAEAARKAGFMWAETFGDAGVVRVYVSAPAPQHRRFMTIGEAAFARCVR